MKPLSDMTGDEIKAAVAERYGQVASSPCAKFNFPVGRKFAESIGYDSALMDSLPASMWESFTGAGNPQPFIDAGPGEIVLDLGCGAGLDLYLYSKSVGENGRVYGLDLSADMIAKAGLNLGIMGISNVELIIGSSDCIPLPDSSVDLVAANGIYNLSPDKDAVMREVFRVIQSGGRTIFAEIVLRDVLPKDDRTEIDDWFRCIGGALTRMDFISRMEAVGFMEPEILSCSRNARTGHDLAECAVIRGYKP